MKELTVDELETKLYGLSKNQQVVVLYFFNNLIWSDTISINNGDLKIYNEAEDEFILMNQAYSKYNTYYVIQNISDLEDKQ